MKKYSNLFSSQSYEYSQKFGWAAEDLGLNSLRVGNLCSLGMFTCFINSNKKVIRHLFCMGKQLMATGHGCLNPIYCRRTFRSTLYNDQMYQSHISSFSVSLFSSYRAIVAATKKITYVISK